MATLLPGVEFCTRQPYPDARRLLAAGVTVAVATDCNPGSCFTSSMAFCVALAVREMHMTTSEAVWAATAGGARALRRTDVGHLGIGARADLILLDAGVTVALATDCNPGSSFTSSMPFCIALAVREMRMTTEEAVWAATAGGARALRRADIGTLAPGARADLILLDAPSHAYLAYRPGVPLIAAVWRAGRLAAGAVTS